MCFSLYGWSSDALDSLDRKNIICNVETENLHKYGFRFIGEEVEWDILETIDNKSTLRTGVTSIPMLVRSVTAHQVVWGIAGYPWVLNRETLVLYQKDPDPNYQCKVMSNRRAYKKEMEKHRLQQDKKVEKFRLEQLKKNEEQRKRNKI